MRLADTYHFGDQGGGFGRGLRLGEYFQGFFVLETNATEFREAEHVFGGGRKHTGSAIQQFDVTGGLTFLSVHVGDNGWRCTVFDV